MRGYDEYTEEIHLLQDDNDVIHITQYDYEGSLNPKKLVLDPQHNKGVYPQFSFTFQY
jgi:hypothetical protein